MQFQTVENQTEITEESVKDSLGIHVRGIFDEYKKERLDYENEWLKDLRQYKGIYDAEILHHIPKGRSQANIRLTRTKVKTMDARVVDMLFPSGKDKNWQIGPTPDPEVSPERIAELRQQIVQARQVEPTEEELEKVEEQLAKKAAEEMENKIDDQLIEGKYSEVCRDVVHSGHLFGTGVLMGPLVEIKKRKHWKNKDGIYQIIEVDELHPYFRHIPIWDYYPDLSALHREECDFEFIRHVMTKHDVRKLARNPGFNNEKINAYLQAHQEGDAEYLYHETQLKQINGNKDAVNDRRRKYEVLEGWGYVDGRDLAACGCQIEEDMMDVEFEANVWVLGSTTIKAVINPTEQQQRPIHLYHFEKDETSLLGISIPSVYRDPANLFNASIRMAIDNAASSAGPVYEVNVSLLDPSEVSTANQIYPFRVFLRTGDDIAAQYPAVRAIKTDSHVDQLLKISELAKQLGDEAVSIPSYMHGENDNGVGRTVGGLSMLMGAANITVKDVIKNFDNGITKSFITALYHWNMQFSKDDDIKGDYDVKAVGSSSLVAKELRLQQNLALIQASRGEDQYVNRRVLWKQVERDSDVGEEFVFTEEESKEFMAEIEAMAMLKAQEMQAKASGAPQPAPIPAEQGMTG